MHYPSRYLQMRVLGAVESAPGKTKKKQIQNVSKMFFTDEEGFKRQFTWRTISTWYYRFKSKGILNSERKKRRDYKSCRKISPEQLLEAINQVKPLFKKNIRHNKTDIYRKIVESGIISRTDLAPTTYYRFIREFELLKDMPANNKRRMAFAMPYANDLWQCDTMFGPFVTHDGKKIQTKLIAFIDDASRVICHGEFFISDSTISLMNAFKKALFKRGVPKRLYCDNGANYSSKELILVCARLGCTLSHTPLRDGAAKGKIERFFRTVRDIFLLRKLDLSSLTVLNKQFSDWVENEYNHKIHSTLEMKPIDRFTLDSNRIRFLANVQENEELFYNEEDRMVFKDNTFSFRNMRYEAPAYLHGRKIQIRFNRYMGDSPVVVYYKAERIGNAQLVNFVANSQIFNHEM